MSNIDIVHGFINSRSNNKYMKLNPNYIPPKKIVNYDLKNMLKNKLSQKKSTEIDISKIRDNIKGGMNEIITEDYVNTNNSVSNIITEIFDDSDDKDNADIKQFNTLTKTKKFEPRTNNVYDIIEDYIKGGDDGDIYDDIDNDIYDERNIKHFSGGNRENHSLSNRHEIKSSKDTDIVNKIINGGNNDSEDKQFIRNKISNNFNPKSDKFLDIIYEYINTKIVT